MPGRKTVLALQLLFVATIGPTVFALKSRRERSRATESSSARGRSGRSGGSGSRQVAGPPKSISKLTDSAGTPSAARAAGGDDAGQKAEASAPGSHIDTPAYGVRLFGSRQARVHQAQRGLTRPFSEQVQLLSGGAVAGEQRRMGLARLGIGIGGRLAQLLLLVFRRAERRVWPEAELFEQALDSAVEAASRPAPATRRAR